MQLTASVCSGKSLSFSLYLLYGVSLWLLAASAKSGPGVEALAALAETSVAVERFAPLASQHGQKFDINPVVEQELPNLLEANRISYAVAINFFFWRQDYLNSASQLYHPFL